MTTALPKAEHIEQVAPGAREFADTLAVQLSTPGVLAAFFAALIGLAAAAAVGFVAAIVSPDASLIGLSGRDVDFLKEGFRLTVGSTLARASGAAGGATPLVPGIFVLAPLLGTAFGAYMQAPRTAALPSRTRLAWAASAGLVLAVLMTVVALFASGDDFDFEIGSVLFYSLLWGAGGAVLGTWWSARRNEPETLEGLLPPIAARWASILRSAFVSLAATVAVAAIVGLAAYQVQALRDKQATLLERGVATALVENVIFAPNLGIGDAAFGMAAQFHGLQSGVSRSLPGLLMPLPLDDNDRAQRALAFVESDDQSSVSSGEYRIFDFGDIYPVWIFIPLLVLLVGSPILFALYSGFAIARRVSPDQPAKAAAYGALTGVVWSLTLTIASAMLAIGAVGSSVFATALVVGAVFGAVGGFLAFGRAVPSQEA